MAEKDTKRRQEFGVETEEDVVGMLEKARPGRWMPSEYPSIVYSPEDLAVDTSSPRAVGEYLANMAIADRDRANIPMGPPLPPQMPAKSYPASPVQQMQPMPGDVMAAQQALPATQPQQPMDPAALKAKMDAPRLGVEKLLSKVKPGMTAGEGTVAFWDVIPPSIAATIEVPEGVMAGGFVLDELDDEDMSYLIQLRAAAMREREERQRELEQEGAFEEGTKAAR